MKSFDSQYKVNSFTYDELNIFDFNSIDGDRDDPPTYIIDCNGKRYTVIKLNYGNRPKDGDFYFESSDSVAFINSDCNYTNEQYYGDESAFNNYCPMRIIKRRRLG